MLARPLFARLDILDSEHEDLRNRLKDISRFLKDKSEGCVSHICIDQPEDSNCSYYINVGAATR